MALRRSNSNDLDGNLIAGRLCKGQGQKLIILLKFAGSFNENVSFLFFK